MIQKLKFFLFFFLFYCFSSIGLESDLSDLKNIPTKSYLLMDSETGVILAEKDSNKRLSPASLTKLMTALVVYDAIDKGEISLKDKFRVSKKARYAVGSRMFLEEGSLVSVSLLLKGLVIQSGNDAAIALAEGLSDSEEAFSYRMNEKAKELDLKDTNFKNATGLPADDHYSSAKDLAKIANSIIKNHYKYYANYKVKSFKYNNIEQRNRNGLLFTDKSVDGLKTGYTESAGYCLVSSAKKNNFRLISIVLGSDSIKKRELASKNLLSFGFNNFTKKDLYNKGQVITEYNLPLAKKPITVITNDKVSIPIPHDRKSIKARFVLKDGLKLPIKKGEHVGDLVIKFYNQELSYPTISNNNVEEINYFSKIFRAIKKWLKSLFS